MKENGAIRVSAPGKLLLLGEFGVAFGGFGMAMAVNRRVVLYPAPSEPVDLENLVDFCRDFAAQRLGVERPRLAWRCNSSRLYEDDVKLGLGSSAAIAVAAVSSLFVEMEREISSTSAQDSILRLSLAVHGAAQGGGGSGIDVAASLFGGVVGLSAGKPAEVKPCRLPEDLRLVTVWSGEAASTPTLLGAVRKFAENSPEQFDVLMSEMRRVVEPFFLAPRGVGDWIVAVQRYGALMDRLGREADVGIVTPGIRRLTALATDLGGTAKPSGAGGGDVVLGYFSNEEAAAEFRGAARDAGVVPLDLAIEPVGVRAASGPDERGA